MAEAGRAPLPPLGLCDPATRRVRRAGSENGGGTGQGTVRLQLDLSEPDELSSPEFNYGELLRSLQVLNCVYLDPVSKSQAPKFVYF